MKEDKSSHKLFVFILFFVFIIFLYKLVDIQLINYSTYRFKVDENSKIGINLYPDRGFIYDRNKKILVGNKHSFDIIVNPNEIKYVDTNIFLNALNFSKEEIISKIELISKTKKNRLVLFKSLTDKEYGLIKEFIHRNPGFYVEKNVLRDYVFDACANILGYIGEARVSDFKKDTYYNYGDITGYSGVEKSYERTLRGTKGINYFFVNAKGSEKVMYYDGKYDVSPQRGMNIDLSIDIELQEYGETLMQNKRGSIVVIEPSSGEIMTLISSPTYSPKLLVGRGRNNNYKELNSQESKPMYDRALLAQYPPGSIFKIVTGLVALQDKSLTKHSTKTCEYGFRLSKNKIIKCDCGTGYTPINIYKAIEKSCNTFFIKSFKGCLDKVGEISYNYTQWYNHVRSFGLGGYLNNDLHTSKNGFIPSVEFYNKVYGDKRWYSSFIVSNAIGQGEILMTPLQMANLAAIVANRGYYYPPHIVKTIENDNIKEEFTNKINTTIDRENFEIIVDGMRRVVASGTARWYEIEGLDICGKTGTAQNTHGEDHSIFIAFAPKDNPKIAISVIVENGGYGSALSVPIASLMIEKYLKKTISKKWVEEYVLKKDLSNEYKQQKKDE